MAAPQPRCPVRRGDYCSLCMPGASGPADCGLVWLLRDDDEDADGGADAEPSDATVEGPRRVGNTE